MAPAADRVAIRTCCGCGQRDVQRVLIRVMCSASGGLTPDLWRRGGGRGAYLHRRATCWDRFVRGKIYVRSLRCSIPRAERVVLIERLRVEMARDAEASPQ